MLCRFFALRWPFFSTHPLIASWTAATPVPLNVDRFRMIPHSLSYPVDNDNDATNLQACTGECDANADCAGSLECFSEKMVNRFLGAQSYGSDREWDYCYDLIYKTNQ